MRTNKKNLNKNITQQGPFFLIGLLSFCLISNISQVGHAAPLETAETKLTSTKLSNQTIKDKTPFRYTLVHWQKYSRDNHNDLLTAGLQLSGLQNATPPASANARQLAYFSNIKALLDTSTDGGFGRLYGPKPSERIPGVEYVAAITSDADIAPAEFSIQIPQSFNQKQPCLVLAPSSGSRDIYGAVGVVGFWALQNGCAVSYTNKGTGTGFYLVEPNKLITVNGHIETPAQPLDWVKPDQPGIRPAQISVATRHAHSTQNPEKDWGKHTLIAAELGIKALNEHFTRRFNQDDVFVLAASISNGGSAVLRAGELDQSNLIDAIVAGEPNINVELDRFSVTQGTKRQYFRPQHALEAFVTQSVYSPCANFNVLPDIATVATFKKQARLACQELLKTQLLSATSVTKLAQQAEQLLLDFGLPNETLWLGPIHNTMGLWEALESTYPSSYARLRLYEDPCGRSFEMASSSTLSTNAIGQLDKIWSLASGIPPTAGVNLSFYQPIATTNKIFRSLSRQTAVKICYLSWIFPELREQFGLQKLLSDDLVAALREGIEETIATANLNGNPTIIIHGRSDRLISVNHSSRPYYFLNQQTKQKQSNLRYIEVLSANHFDALLSYAPYNQSLIPLHLYFEQALDAMHGHFYDSKKLPLSQVIKPKLRQVKVGKLEPLSLEHLPSISNNQAPIELSNDGLILPF